MTLPWITPSFIARPVLCYWVLTSGDITISAKLAERCIALTNIYTYSVWRVPDTVPRIVNIFSTPHLFSYPITSLLVLTGNLLLRSLQFTQNITLVIAIIIPNMRFTPNRCYRCHEFQEHAGLPFIRHSSFATYFILYVWVYIVLLWCEGWLGCVLDCGWFARAATFT